MPLAPYVENPSTSTTAPAEPQKLKKLEKSKKLNKIPLAIPNIRLAYEGVNKLADSKRGKYIVPARRILKPAMIFKPKAELVDKTKPLDLAFIGAAPFQYLAKQKNVEIFAVSI